MFCAINFDQGQLQVSAFVFYGPALPSPVYFFPLYDRQLNRAVVQCSDLFSSSGLLELLVLRLEELLEFWASAMRCDTSALL